MNKKIKAIKSPEDAFAIIESCCDRNPIQDNFDFNRAKLRLGKLKTMLGKKYNVYISKTAIIACRNIGDLKQLIYKYCVNID